MPYSLKDGEDASKIQIFYIDSGNKAVEVDASYDADSKCVVFSTDHFSTWYVDFDTYSGGGSGSGNMTLIIVAVVIVATIAVVAFLIFTGKIDISALTAKKEWSQTKGAGRPPTQTPSIFPLLGMCFPMPRYTCFPGPTPPHWPLGSPRTRFHLPHVLNTAPGKRGRPGPFQARNRHALSENL